MQPLDSFYNLANNFQPIAAATTQNILSRLQGTVTISARFRVTSMTLQRIPVMVEPTSWRDPLFDVFDPSDIGPLIAPAAAQLTHDTSRPVHRDLSFTMLDPSFQSLYTTLSPVTGSQGFPFNPLNNLIELAFVISNQWAGVTTTFEVPLGFYTMFLPSAQLQPQSRLITWQGLSLEAIVQQTSFLSDYVVYQGYPGGIIQAVIDMWCVGAIPISRGGTGLTPTGNDDAGPALNPGQFTVDASGNQPVLFDNLFQAGTSRVEAANSLLTSISYKPIWPMSRTAGPNATAFSFAIQPIPFYQSGILPTPSWDYSTNSSTIAITPIQQDFSSQANSSICNIARVEGSPLQAPQGSNGAPAGQKPTYSDIEINTGYAADGVTVNSVIGTQQLQSLTGGPRAITRFVRNDKLATLAMAQLLAKITLQQGSMLPETLQFNSLHHPLHEDQDVLITNVTIKGQTMVPSSATSPFIETSWKLPLKASGGRMEHQCARIVAL